MAMFSRGKPSALIPTRFSIQKTTNDPCSYALGSVAGTVSSTVELVNGIWNANDTNE